MGTVDTIGLGNCRRSPTGAGTDSFCQGAEKVFCPRLRTHQATVGRDLETTPRSKRFGQVEGRSEREGCRNVALPRRTPRVTKCAGTFPVDQQSA